MDDAPVLHFIYVKFSTLYNYYSCHFHLAWPCPGHGAMPRPWCMLFHHADWSSRVQCALSREVTSPAPGIHAATPMKSFEKAVDTK